MCGRSSVGRRCGSSISAIQLNERNVTKITPMNVHPVTGSVYV